MPLSPPSNGTSMLQDFYSLITFVHLTKARPNQCPAPSFPAVYILPLYGILFVCVMFVLIGKY